MSYASLTTLAYIACLLCFFLEFFFAIYLFLCSTHIYVFFRVFFCYLSISMFYTYLFRGLCYPYWHIRKTHLQTFKSINVIVGHTKLCQCSARLYYCHRRNWSFLHSGELRTPRYDGLSTWCTLCKRIQW